MKAQSKIKNVLKVLRLDIYIKKVQNWCTAGADSQQNCGRFLVQGLRVQQMRAFEGITLQLPMRPIPDFTPPDEVISILLQRATLHRWQKNFGYRRRTLTSDIWTCMGCLCIRPLFAYVSHTSLIQQSVYLSYRGAVCFFPTLCFYSPSSPLQQLVSSRQRKPLKALKAPGRSWARAGHLTWPAFWKKKNDCPPLDYV